MDIFIFLDYSNYIKRMVCISVMVFVKDRNLLRMRILRLVWVEMDYIMGKFENVRFMFLSFV